MKLRIATLALASTLMASAALSADISGPPPVENLRPSYDWNGPYLGVIGGLACMSGGTLVDHTGGATWDMNGCGGKIGAIGGMNYQMDNFVLGVEGDYEWGQKNWIKNNDTGGNFGYDLDGMATLRARAGLAVDHTLLFVTGGAAYGRGTLHAINGAATPDTNISNSAWGWTVGGGIEQALTSNLHLRLDYLYTRLGSKDYTSGCCNTTIKWHNEHEVRLGGTWNFNNIW